MEAEKLTTNHIQKIFKPTQSAAHKGTQGHALLIGGSYGKMGSIALSTKAALRSGAGLATAFVPACGYEILQISVPEAMVLTDAEDRHLSRIQFEIQPDAVGIGPGIGQQEAVQKAFGLFLERVKFSLVVDADAINILSKNRSLIAHLPENAILTPHPKELERLVGSFESEHEVVRAAMQFASEHHVVLVLKGAPTKITDGTSLFENSTGNAGLATAGSGDVLTGILTALLAQGYASLDAAILGVYIHGLAADIGTETISKESFIASDIIGNLGKAFLQVNRV